MANRMTAINNWPPRMTYSFISFLFGYVYNLSKDYCPFFLITLEKGHTIDLLTWFDFILCYVLIWYYLLIDWFLNKLLS